MKSMHEDFRSWEHPEEQQPAPTERIQYKQFSAGTWLKLTAIGLVKLVTMLAWAASFQGINPMASGIFVADYLPFPLPGALQDLSASFLINLTLGALAVILPSVLWHYALKHDVLHNPRDFFADNPLRITIFGLLVLAYSLTISLEVMALMSRVESSLDTGPIPVLGNQPEILPLAVASAALILGSCLLGLASASLSRSIHSRYSA